MSIPIYQRIKNDIITEIENKPANSPLLSERDLAVQHGASRMTVRRAVNELVEEGFLYRNANKGTFIADKKLLRKNTLNTVEDVNYRVFYFDLKASSSIEIQNILDIRSDDQIVRLIRIMLSGETPVAVEEIYASRQRLSDSEVEQMTQWKTLNKLIDGNTKNCQFKPMIIPVKYARILKLAINSPIIMSECTISDKQGKTIIFIKTYNNPEERILEITT